MVETNKIVNKQLNITITGFPAKTITNSVNNNFNLNA